MREASFSERLRYRFDNFMSRGTIALVIALFTITLVLIIITATILIILNRSLAGQTPQGGAETIGLAEAIWQVTMRTVDTGTVAGDTGWSFRILGFLITLGGIFIFSALVGVLASGLDERLGELRRGRSRVVESGHTVILGWSPQVFTIINELAFANHSLAGRQKGSKTGSEDNRSACITILAEMDKLQMEEEIRTKAPDTLGTRVVCRSGNPLDPDDLRIVSPEAARAIIILSTGGKYPDMPAAKTLMALSRDRDRRSQKYHIVTSVQRPANLEIFRMIGGDEAQIFMTDRLISYLIAQTCRQSGLSVVYSELFSFEGAAIYFKEIAELNGAAYREAIYLFEDSTLIGIQSADGSSHLNPPADTIIQPGERVIAIAKDANAIKISPRISPKIYQDAIRAGQSTPIELDRLLILGWNRRAAMILDQLTHYASAGSQITILSPEPTDQMKNECASIDFQSIQVSYQHGNPAERATLEKLTETGYSSIIILCPTEIDDIQLADAYTMITLMHLRDISRLTGRNFSIVSEIMDVRNRELSQVTSIDDVIISERLVALALTQIAENKAVVPVFIDLLTASGSEIYLKPASDYVIPGRTLDFFTIIASAQLKGETAIGYRLLAEASQVEKSFGVHLNPEKSAPISFTAQDSVIVLAET